jgi:hypothetical protein
MNRSTLPRQSRFVAPTADGRSSDRGLRLLVAVGLVVAGWIHLVLVPEHIEEAMVLGLGFLAAAIVQIGLAIVVVWRPMSWVFAAAVAVNAILIAIYAYAVVVGLPFEGGHEAMESAGLVVGNGEPIELSAAVSKVAEIAALATALRLLGAKYLRAPAEASGWVSREPPPSGRGSRASRRRLVPAPGSSNRGRGR